MGLESGSFIADLVGTNPAGSDGKFEGDNHLRLIKQVLQNTFPGFAGRFNRSQSKGSNYSPVLNDSHSVINCTAALTLNFATAAATLGNGWMTLVYASGGDVTIDPNGAETINGSATVIVPQNTLALVFCDGAAFVCAQMPLTRIAAVGTISGNTTLTFADVGVLKNITASAIITLPAASALAVGDTIRLRSSTVGDVTVIRAGGDTIDGLTTYRIPAYTYVEIMKIAAATYIFSKKPEHDVGTIRPTGAATAALGWSLMDQNTLTRTTEAGLFAVIGTTFGAGNGSTTFGKDARGRTMVAAGTGDFVFSGVDADVTVAADTINVPSNTRTWITGMAVVYAVSSGSITGLVNSTTYFVIRNSATTIKLASSLANAQNGTAIDITAKSSPVFTLTHTYEARTLGERGGEESHGMSSTELLAHTPGNGSLTAGQRGSAFTITPGGSGLVVSTLESGTESTPGIGGAIASVGGNALMNIRDPFLGVNYEIKL